MTKGEKDNKCTSSCAACPKTTYDAKKLVASSDSKTKQKPKPPKK